jgi:hypothetical protein
VRPRKTKIVHDLSGFRNPKPGNGLWKLAYRRARGRFTAMQKKDY